MNTQSTKPTYCAMGNFSIYAQGQKRPKPRSVDPEAVELRKRVDKVRDDQELRRSLRDVWEL